MKKLHIFHHYDADGYASAAVIIRHFREEIKNGLQIKCYSCKHGKPMNFSEVDPKKDIVYIVDYSFTDPRDVKSVEELTQKFIDERMKPYAQKEIALKYQLVWIDHHESSRKLIEDSETLATLASVGLVCPDNIYAGCMLTWLFLTCPGFEVSDENDLKDLKYYISQNCPIWGQYVDDYDKWAHKMENSTAFCTGVNCTNGGLWNNFINPNGSYATYVSKDADGITRKFIKKGKVIDEFRKNENEAALRGAGFYTTLTCACEDKELEVLCINKAGNSLLFGDYIKDVDAVIVFTFDGHLWNYSIFSHESKEFPVNKVAEMYKNRYGMTGGGHKHAAGWATRKCIFDGDESIPKTKISFKEWLKRKENK